MTDLEQRVEERRRELIAEAIEHKASPSRAGTADAIEQIQGRLYDLKLLLKEGVSGGWAKVDDGTREKLEAWIAR